MQLETINKFYLELSQIATAKTAREMELEELLRSACCIAERQGEGTAWGRFIESIHKVGIGGVTARTYRILPTDEELLKQTVIKVIVDQQRPGGALQIK